MWNASVFIITIIGGYRYLGDWKNKQEFTNLFMLALKEESKQKQVTDGFESTFAFNLSNFYRGKKTPVFH